jgi:hypothetical protein
VLDLAVDRLTPRYEDSYSALNAIVDLDQYGALVLAAGKSELSSKKQKDAAQTVPLPKGTKVSPILIQTGGSSPAQGPNDTLVLFFEPDRVSLDPVVGRELRFPRDQRVPMPHPSQISLESNGMQLIRFNDYRPKNDDKCVDPPPDVNARLIAAKKNVLRLWLRLLDIYEGTQPLSDEKTAAAVAAPSNRGANQGRTRTTSTTGEEPHAPLPKYPTKAERSQHEQRIDAAATADELDKIIRLLPRWIELRTSPMAIGGYRNPAPVLRTRSALGLIKAAATLEAPIEFLPADQAKQLRAEPRNDHHLKTGFFVLDGETNNDTARWARETNCYLYTRWLGSENDVRAREERELGYLRRYLLVEISEEPPTDAYISVRGQDKKWYSISNADKISRNNFALITQIMTMRAVPSQTPPLTPTIPVAGRGP